MGPRRAAMRAVRRLLPHLAAACAALALAGPAAAQLSNGWEVTAVLFFPDGKLLVSAGLDGHLRFWDVARGSERLKVKVAGGGITGAALSPDGATLAAACSDGRVRVWDVARLRE